MGRLCFNFRLFQFLVLTLVAAGCNQSGGEGPQSSSQTVTATDHELSNPTATELTSPGFRRIQPLDTLQSKPSSELGGIISGNPDRGGSALRSYCFEALNLCECEGNEAVLCNGDDGINYFDGRRVFESQDLYHCAGDTNGDLVVDEVDLKLVQDNLLKHVDGGPEDGDIDFSGRVLLYDLRVVERNQGKVCELGEVEVRNGQGTGFEIRNSGHIRMDQSIVSPTDDEFTISTWVYSVRKIEVINRVQVLLSEMVKKDGFEWLFIDKEGRLGSNLGNEFLLSAEPLLTNRDVWYHVALRLQRNNLQLFFNGRLVASTDKFEPKPKTIKGSWVFGNFFYRKQWRDTYREKLFRNDRFKTGELNFAGYMSDFRVFDRAISEEEMLKLYEMGKKDDL